MTRQQLLNKIGADPSRGAVIVENQNVRDIISLIKYKHGKHGRDYDKIAGYFWRGSVLKTCEYLFDWCKENIRYKIEDEELQTVSSPMRILEKGEGDCKHYSCFIAGILDALTRAGHPFNWSFRFASYNPFSDEPGHVFVVVKYQGQEIWIDPVLDEFDYQKPYMYAMDKRVKAPALSGVPYYAAGQGAYRPRGLGLSRLASTACVSSMGDATTSAISSTLLAISPALAAVPVVGWAAAAGGEVVGLALSLFGSGYTQQASVRWLIQLYQYYVLGQTGITATNANQSLAATAISWFSHVLGVPVLDRTMFDLLKGYQYAVDISNNYTLDQRVKGYLSHTSTQGVTYAQALQAVKIADTMNYHSPAGSWRNMTAAPSLIQSPNLPPGTTLAPGTTNQASIFPKNIWLFLGGGLLLMLLFSNKKRHA